MEEEEKILHDDSTVRFSGCKVSFIFKEFKLVHGG